MEESGLFGGKDLDDMAAYFAERCVRLFLRIYYASFKFFQCEGTSWNYGYWWNCPQCCWFVTSRVPSLCDAILTLCVPQGKLLSMQRLSPLLLKQCTTEWSQMRFTNMVV